MKPLPAVGQTVYSLNVGNAARRGVEQKLTLMKVIKVGRKYFTACQPCREGNEWSHIQFHLDTWREKTTFCANHQLYSSEQEWLDEKESGQICSELWKAFEYGRNGPQLDLTTLRKIKEILP